MWRRYPCLQTRHGTKPGVFYIRRRRICAAIFSSGRYYGGKNKGRTKWVEGDYQRLRRVRRVYREYILGHESRSVVRLCRYTIRSARYCMVPYCKRPYGTLVVFRR